MVSTSDFKKGMKIEFRDAPCEIIDFQHVKMGRGGAIVRTRLKNLKTGGIVDETFKSGEKFESPELEERSMQYLYKEGDTYHFMDTENYEQVSVDIGQLGDAIKFLKENMVVSLLFYKGEPLSIELPIFVELMITKTEPGIRGDTASGGSKPATLETGAVVKVPLHLNEGDIIKVDTRTSEYIEKVR